MFLIDRILLKYGRRIMCYIDDRSTPGEPKWVLFSGRPCDPNKITWEFRSLKAARKFAMQLLDERRVTEFHILKTFAFVNDSRADYRSFQKLGGVIAA